MTNGGYVTLAYTNEGNYGFAFCSPKDEFSEEYGEKLAISRIGGNCTNAIQLPKHLAVLLEILYWGEYPESMKEAFIKLVGTQTLYAAEGSPAHMEIMKPKFYV